MRIRALVLSMAIGTVALGSGFGCESVKKASTATSEKVTGDVSKIYDRDFDAVKSAVKDTAKDLDVIKVTDVEDLTKDAKKRYTLTTRTKTDKQLIFIVVREDDKRASVKIDTAAFSGGDFRKTVVSTLEHKLGT